MSKSMNSLLTQKELAKLLRCSEQTIRLWRKKGLPSLKVIRLVRFDSEQVLEWMRSQNNKAA